MKAKKIVGAIMKILVSLVVLAYLALHTINFFKYTFPADQFYYAYLGFGLTGLGAIAYLCIFLWDADTPIKKTISLIMIIVCGLGEVAAASFGMTIEAWAKNGWAMTEADFRSMLLVIMGLAFLHLIALVLYVASDKIAEMFRDEDHDGIPDYRDPVDNRTGQPFVKRNGRAYAEDVEQSRVDPTSQPRR
jgi:hypothetical protein